MKPILHTITDPNHTLFADKSEHDFVYDETNRLVWSRTLRDEDGDPRRFTAGAEGESGEDAEACAALGPGWRLPSDVELASIVDRSRHEPATFAPFIDDTVSDAYATSTPVSGWPHHVWAVNFYDGNVSGHGRYGRRCVRAVRSLGPSSAGQ